jgi:DNA-binding NarL/FixJ family response regulator
MMRAISILLAAPHAMFRDALRCVLGTAPDMTVVGEASTGDETVEQVRRQRPDILLLDLAVPEFAGIDALCALSRNRDPVRSLVMIDDNTDGRVVAALKHGARGIVPKRTATPLLLKSIRVVFRGEFWVGHDNIPHLVNHIREAAGAPGSPARGNRSGLTTRELEIAALIIDGATNRDIAQKLSISEQTVKHHLTSVFGKLSVSNRLELVLFAMREENGTSLRPQ